MIPAKHFPWPWLTNVVTPFRRQRWNIVVNQPTPLGWLHESVIVEAYSLVGALRKPDVLMHLIPGCKVKAFRLN